MTVAYVAWQLGDVVYVKQIEFSVFAALLHLCLAAAIVVYMARAARNTFCNTRNLVFSLYRLILVSAYLALIFLGYTHPRQTHTQKNTNTHVQTATFTAAMGYMPHR